MCAQFVIPTTPQSLSEIWYALNEYKCFCLLLSRTHRKEQMSVLMARQWLHHSRCSRADELSWVLSAVELTRWSLMITEGQGTPQQMFNCSCAVGNSARTPLYRRTIKSSQIERFLGFRMFETIKTGRHIAGHIKLCNCFTSTRLESVSRLLSQLARGLTIQCGFHTMAPSRSSYLLPSITGLNS